MDDHLERLIGTTASWMPDHLSDTEAWVGHIPFAFWIVDAARPHTLVELGTQSGNSYLAMCQAVKRLGLTTACFAVDTWKGDAHTGAYGEEVFTELSAYHDEHYGAFSRLVRSSFAEASSHFGDGTVDLLHIDGLHTYEAVTEDMALWVPKLSERAVVMLHDTNVREQSFGVWAFWNELAAHHPHFLFLHSHGLGVVGIGSQIPERVRALFDASPDEHRTSLVRDHFWRLGETVKDRLRIQRLKTQSAVLGAGIAAGDLQNARLTTEIERLADADREIARLTGALAVHDAEIQRITHEVAFRDAEIQRITHEVAFRDAEIQRITGEVAFRDAEIHRITNEVAFRDVEIRRLQANAIAHQQAALARRRLPRPRNVARALRASLQFASREHLKFAWQRVRRDGVRPTLRFSYRTLLAAAGLDGAQSARIVDWPDASTNSSTTPAALVTRPVERLTSTPLISMVMPVYDVAERYLRSAIESVRSQQYQRWELCIADDASRQPHVRAVLAEYCRLDPRIRVVYRGENGNISAATNSALELATGEFVAFLDHDDELTPDALMAFARVLDAKPETDALYSDLALVRSDGTGRVDFVKPDWSPEFFRHVMYVGHLLMVRRTVLDAAGLFDSRFDGVQDFELMLRLSERTKHIEHVREVLYLWRGIPGSIASGGDAKPDAGVRQVEAVNAHLRRIGVPATAAPHPRIPHRLVMVPSPRKSSTRISVIVWCREPAETLRALESIGRATTLIDVEWILVGRDHYDDEAFVGKRIMGIPCGKTIGRGTHLHAGAKAASGEYLLFFDGGLEVVAGDLLTEFAFHLDNPEVGAVGPMVVGVEGTVQAAGLGLAPGNGIVRPLLRGQPADADGYFGALACSREVSALFAVCMGIRADVYARSGGFDRLLPMRLFDVDLCMRLRALGLRNLYVATCRVVDRVGAIEDWADALDLAFLGNVWERELAAGDPYYDPHGGLA